NARGYACRHIRRRVSLRGLFVLVPVERRITMNRVTPRWKTILLARVMMLALVLQACSQDRGGAGTGAANEPFATALERREWKVRYFGAPQEDVAFGEAKLNDYFRPRINATVKPMPVASSDYKTRTELLMKTGEK